MPITVDEWLSGVPAPFPTSISNSSRELFAKCPQRWAYKYFLGDGDSEASIHLVAGGAFAKGIETARKAFFSKRLVHEEAVHLGVEALKKEYLARQGEQDFSAEAKSLPGMVGALYSYFNEWNMERDYIQPMPDAPGEAAELDFAIPLNTRHPTTNEPILYSGVIDLLGYNARNDTIWVEDDKTTTALGPKWIKQWRLDSQLTGYCWAARQYNIPVAGCLVRGTSILKRSYGHAEVLEPRTEHEIQDWHTQLLETIEEMKDVWARFNTRQRITRRLDKFFCNAYGSQCPFLNACGSPQPEDWLRPSEHTGPGELLDNVFEGL